MMNEENVRRQRFQVETTHRKAWVGRFSSFRRTQYGGIAIHSQHDATHSLPGDIVTTDSAVCCTLLPLLLSPSVRSVWVGLVSTAFGWGPASGSRSSLGSC